MKLDICSETVYEDSVTGDTPLLLLISNIDDFTGEARGLIHFIS